MTATTERPVKGLLGEKLGMTQVWDADNRLIPVTVVAVGPCVVTQLRSEGVDGYNAVQIGYGQIDPRKVTKPLTGHFEKAGVAPRRHLLEGDELAVVAGGVVVSGGDEHVVFFATIDGFGVGKRCAALPQAGFARVAGGGHAACAEIGLHEDVVFVYPAH